MNDTGYRLNGVKIVLWILLACLAVPLGASAGDFPYALRWKRLGGGQGPALTWDDAALLVGGADGRLMALRRADGVRLWQRRGSGPLKRPLALREERLYYGDTWGRVQCRDAATGQTVWQVQRLGWGDAEIAVGARQVFAAGADGWLYALARTDGAEAWRVRLGARSGAGLLAYGDRVVVGTADGRLLAVEAASGRRLHEVEVGARLRGGLVRLGGLVVAGCSDGYVRAYKGADLTPVWQRRLGALVVEPLVAAGKTLVAAADNGWVYGLDPEGGAVRWQRGLGSAATGIAGDGADVVVATDQGRLWGIGAGTGEVVWRQTLLEGTGLDIWVAGDELLVRAADGYLYAFGRKKTADRRGDVLWEEWWERRDLGRKTGYARYTAVRQRHEGQDAVRVDGESVAWRSGFVRVESQAWVDTAYRPLSFWRRRIEESQVVVTEGRWQEGHLELERRLGADVRRWTVAGADGLALPEVALRRVLREGLLAAGRRDTVGLFDYGALEGAAAAVEAVPAGGGFRVVWRPLDDDVQDIVGVDSVDAAGRHVFSGLPSLGLSQRRTDEAGARAWTPPGTGKEVVLDREAAGASGWDAAVVALPDAWGDWRRFLVEDDRQRVVEDAAGGRRLHLRRATYDGADAVALPVAAAPLRPFLQPSLYIQSDDPRIAALARRLVGESDDAWQAARRLQRWVYDHMVPAPTDVRFKSSLEVLEDMEGTCSEYTALYMALCRAVGLPARAAVGFVAGGGTALTLHIWAQVWVGRWVDVDPSWDQMQLDAAHITCGVGRLTPGDMARMNLPLQRFLARTDTLALLSYRRGDEQVLAAAEDLFAQAEKAQSRFADERAAELFYGVGLLPWNRRSAPALIEISRYRLRRQEFDEAAWALDRLLRQDPTGAAADKALFHLARVEQARGDTAAALARLERVVAEYPGSPVADEALGLLAEAYEKRQGCVRAVPYYERLRREYGRSGWAAVAASALDRCRRKRAQTPGGSVDGIR